MQIFAQGAPFDYGVTLSDAVDMPVNLGMQFVARGRYLNAIGFLNDVIAIYPFNETFIAGQVGTLTHPHAWQWCILPTFLWLLSQFSLSNCSLLTGVDSRSHVALRW
jgi:hypothetical protein